MSKFGYDLEEYVDNKDKCIAQLALHLKLGNLGLLLGAGVSLAMGLPNWLQHTKRCVEEKMPGTIVRDSSSTDELKNYASQFKASCSTLGEYLDVISRNLYKNINFDFSLAKKDLLISLTALIIGRSRGNVQNVMTYNFDSVLEWYLRTNGLHVNIVTSDQLINRTSDVNVIHLHGYLPHDPKFGVPDKFLIYTKEEFEDRQIQPSYKKEMMMDFFKRQIFLSIGLSKDSLINDVCPYLRDLTRWHEGEKISRKKPYGFAFITDANAAEKKKMLETGIIPCVLHRDEIPNQIFRIAQDALPLS